MSTFVMLVFALAGGRRVTLRFTKENNRENISPPAQPPTPAQPPAPAQPPTPAEPTAPAQPTTPAPACDGGSDGALAAFPAASASAEDGGELWSAPKTKFFIAKYAEMKDLVGKTRALRYAILCLRRFAACRLVIQTS